MDDRDDFRSMPSARPGDGDGQPARAATTPHREGAVTAHAAESNRLLRALPIEEYERLLLQLTPVRLRLKQALI